jgi:hypothetical protein
MLFKLSSLAYALTLFFMMFLNRQEHHKTYATEHGYTENTTKPGNSFCFVYFTRVTWLCLLLGYFYVRGLSFWFCTGSIVDGLGWDCVVLD